MDDDIFDPAMTFESTLWDFPPTQTNLPTDVSTLTTTETPQRDCLRQPYAELSDAVAPFPLSASKGISDVATTESLIEALQVYSRLHNANNNSVSFMTRADGDKLSMPPPRKNNAIAEPPSQRGETQVNNNNRPAVFLVNKDYWKGRLCTSQPKETVTITNIQSKTAESDRQEITCSSEELSGGAILYSEEASSSSIDSEPRTPEIRPLAARSQSEETQPPQVSPDELTQRTVWFRRPCGPHSTSQTTAHDGLLAIVFTERHYYGPFLLTVYSVHMAGRNMTMGCRISKDRIVLLDGYRMHNSSLCIVATISTCQNPKPKKTTQQPRKVVKTAGQQLSRFVPHQVPGSLNQTTAKESTEPTQWFSTGRQLHSISQTSVSKVQSPVVFSERHFYGVLKPAIHASHMTGQSFEDGYGDMYATADEDPYLDLSDSWVHSLDCNPPSWEVPVQLPCAEQLHTTTQDPEPALQAPSNIEHLEPHSSALQAVSGGNKRGPSSSDLSKRNTKRLRTALDSYQKFSSRAIRHERAITVAGRSPDNPQLVESRLAERPEGRIEEGQCAPRASSHADAASQTTPFTVNESKTEPPIVNQQSKVKQTVLYAPPVTSAELTGRAVWFPNIVTPYFKSQSYVDTTEPAVIFSSLCTHGVVISISHKGYMAKYLKHSNSAFNQTPQIDMDQSLDELYFDLLATDSENSRLDLSIPWGHSLPYESLPRKVSKQPPSVKSSFEVQLAPTPSFQASSDADPSDLPSSVLQSFPDADKLSRIFLDQLKSNIDELQTCIDDHSALPSRNVQHDETTTMASCNIDNPQLAGTRPDHPNSHSSELHPLSDAGKMGRIFLDQLKRNIEELQAYVNDHSTLSSHDIQHNEAIIPAGYSVNSPHSAEIEPGPRVFSGLHEKPTGDDCSFSETLPSPFHADTASQTDPPTLNELETELTTVCQQSKERQPVFRVPPVTSAELNGRVVWQFRQNCCNYVLQSGAGETASPVIFSERCIYGEITTKCYKNHMGSYLKGVSYRIDSNRIIFMDGFAHGVDNWTLSNVFVPHELDEKNLKVEEFRKLYPLKDNGFVAFLSENRQLVMASYGKPPLGAIILRSDGTNLVPIARSTDNVITVASVQNGDFVVVGPFGAMLELQSRRLNLIANESIKEMAEKVYGILPEKSFCIVASILPRKADKCAP
ncbi:hypothetical protein PSACC_03333 [Paramicrosporidium saccamoebae]|uniref:Uncharacterized protein n=1 Tax=Paramicrosporidium saccamoebae TaxID=1246581 RepID=A0A2H9TGE8_9FUNG|nr:hypothetical protein PSACC_03333 [Paramicrosporidium saccamoebae]